MKNFISPVILLLIITSLFTSCDVLEENPKSLVVEGFYNTPAEAEAGVAAIYQPLRGPWSNWWMSLLDSQTEYGAGYVSVNFDGHSSFQGLTSTGINHVSRLWQQFYNSIRNANFVIKNVPDSEVLTQEQKDRFIAEAKFMRALTYFNLVRAWGGLPLKTEENLDEMNNIPRATKEQVYELIINDLTFAEEHLSDDPPNLGRPSIWTAKTVLSEVHLYTENYSVSANLGAEVIESGKYALEPVTEADDFNNVFGPNPSSPEEVFYFRYNNNSSSSIVTFTMPIDAEPYFSGTSYGIFCVTGSGSVHFFSNWDDGDLRKKFNWYEIPRNECYVPHGLPWPTDDVDTFYGPKKYNAPGATTATNPFPVYRYTDVLLNYSEASARVANGPTDDSVEKLNMVRRRAYGYSPMETSPVDVAVSDFSGLEEFIDLVVEERGFETQFEGKRWFDLVRTGRADRVIMENTGIQIAEKHLLYPIPPIEIDLNEGISQADQNPGY